MDICLFEQGDRNIERWSNQFVRASPSTRRRVAMAAHLTHAQIVRIIDNAASYANGNNNRLIMTVGHGGIHRAANHTVIGSLVDLAPHRAFRVQRHLAFYNIQPGTYDLSEHDADQNVIRRAVTEPRYRPWVRHARQNQSMRNIYDQIGDVLQRRNIHHVVFHTCNIGNDTAFIQQISNDWHTTITAYTRRVIFNDVEDNGNYVRTYLEFEQNGSGNNTERGRTEIPAGPLAVTVQPM